MNDCLQTGPNFIPKLIDVLIKFRSYSYALTADIEKAFLMVGINNSDGDAVHFLWLEDPSKPDSSVLHLRFTRLVFGLRPSPAILGAVISHHLSQHHSEHPQLVEQLENCLYVDDLITGTDDIEQAFKLYQNSKSIMKKVGLNLRKWNSNCASLLERIRDCESVVCNNVIAGKHSITEEEESFAKSTTGSLNFTNNGNFSKLLGITWDNNSDKFLFDFSDLIEYTRNLPSNPSHSKDVRPARFP